nr:hypothetical protein [uncultured Flavobacterium sp.]
MSNTRSAQLYFMDEDPGNQIISIAILHTSLKKGQYVNPNPNEKDPYSVYAWNIKDSLGFEKVGDWWEKYCLTIDKDQHDVWAVTLQRRHNRYVEYLEQKEGFWKKLGEEVVKEVCNAAIDTIDFLDDETTTPVLEFATDKLIHHLFTKDDGDVMIKNWVHWASYKIEFKLKEHSAKIHSTEHSTSCKVERFGNQNEKKMVNGKVNAERV